jgi:Domain of unknown function (DUF362)
MKPPSGNDLGLLALNFRQQYYTLSGTWPTSADPTRTTERSRVTILQAQQYSQQLDQILPAGLSLFAINVAGNAVVLKPNLVNYVPGNAINTHPSLVLAAAESFRRMGAKSVVVAEGPGHQRDTELVLFWATGNTEVGRGFGIRIDKRPSVTDLAWSRFCRRLSHLDEKSANRRLRADDTP